ncbi:MAG: hypothetical protein M1375_01130 [Candidatus Thermoplasmatota archaeon]|nr:hypothetical protein [Candidatus Thermoplasmatota archaeon]MCL5790562.1 hypothetical protein [Candidatus Thermoplasmatota archaeon]
MSLLNRKSREELEIETQMNIQMLKKKSENHARQCDTMAEKYEKKSKEAAEIGNGNLSKVFSEKARALRDQASKIRSFVLVVEDMEMMKDQSSVMGSFSDAMKSFVKTMSKGQVSPAWMSQMEGELDKAIAESERVGDLFGGLLDDVGQNVPPSMKNDSPGEPAEVSRDIENMEKRLRERMKSIEDDREKTE